MARGGVTPNVTWTYKGITVHPANGERMPGGLRFRWWATTPRGEMLRTQTRPEMRELINERGGPAAVKEQSEEYRIWRRTPAGVTRKYTVRMSLPGAQAVLGQLRDDGDKSQLGIERVVITEESYGIEWQERQ